MTGVQTCALPICDSVPSHVKAMTITIDALLDLIRRRPELKNKKVHIEGTGSGTAWHLEPEGLKEMKKPESWRKLYCSDLSEWKIYR